MTHHHPFQSNPCDACNTCSTSNPFSFHASLLILEAKDCCTSRYPLYETASDTSQRLRYAVHTQQLQQLLSVEATPVACRQRLLHVGDAYYTLYIRSACCTLSCTHAEHLLLPACRRTRSDHIIHTFFLSAWKGKMKVHAGLI